MEFPSRVVTLVVSDSSGSVLGALPPFVVDTPWWMDLVPVVREAEARFRLQVTVLRLLSTERSEPHGGAVTYLVELDVGVVPSQKLDPWRGTLHDDVNRVSYAHIGGPATDLDWAKEVLGSQGQEIVGRPEQCRTWNLSSIWKIQTRCDSVWLKVVPAFFAHEGLVIEEIGAALKADGSRPTLVPQLLAHDGPRILLVDIPGGDRHEAQLSERMQMIDDLVDLQHTLHRQSTIARLLANGVPDWRGPLLTSALVELIERSNTVVGPGDHDLLTVFARSLPERFGEVDRCGLPDSLVHGDFHAGNIVGGNIVGGIIVGGNVGNDDRTSVGGPGSRTIIDWGDSGIGHPLLDQPAFLSSSPTDDRRALQDHWSNAWRRAVPGSQPERAAELLAPVAAARQALVYQTFLDAIENNERRYHQADVPRWLHRTAETVRNE